MSKKFQKDTEYAKYDLDGDGEMIYSEYSHTPDNDAVHCVTLEL